MNILKRVHRLMVGEFFSFSKFYFKYYVNVLPVFKKNFFVLAQFIDSFKGKWKH